MCVGLDPVMLLLFPLSKNMLTSLRNLHMTDKCIISSESWLIDKDMISVECFGLLISASIHSSVL